MNLLYSVGIVFQCRIKNQIVYLCCVFSTRKVCKNCLCWLIQQSCMTTTKTSSAPSKQQRLQSDRALQEYISPIPHQSRAMCDLDTETLEEDPHKSIKNYISCIFKWSLSARKAVKREVWVWYVMKNVIKTTERVWKFILNINISHWLALPEGTPPNVTLTEVLMTSRLADKQFNLITHFQTLLKILN